MKYIVVGCGRVGSELANRLAAAGHDVCVVDQEGTSFHNLSPSFRGRTIEGEVLDRQVLRRAGIEDADAVVVSTDGDNTNIVVGQVAQKRFGIQCVVVRLLDPARAEFYATQGMRTVCPTSNAIDVLMETVRTCEVS